MRWAKHGRESSKRAIVEAAHQSRCSSRHLPRSRHSSSIRFQLRSAYPPPPFYSILLNYAAFFCFCFFIVGINRSGLPPERGTTSHVFDGSPSNNRPKTKQNKNNDAHRRLKTKQKKTLASKRNSSRGKK